MGDPISPKRPWATKSAAQRIGLVPCPGCNSAGCHADILTGSCAWCWNDDLGLHTRFIAVDKAIEWATAHGMDFHDVCTPVERPINVHDTPLPPTDPAPAVDHRREPEE